MNARPFLPRDLQAVIWFLFLNGFVAIAATVWNVAHLLVNIDLGLLAIPAAFGLRRHARGWRIFTLIHLGLGLVGCAAVAAFMTFSVESFPIRISGFLVPWDHPAAATAGALALCLLHAWMICVLTRREVRALFASDDFAAA